jgi:hypothetical protein
VVLRGLCDAKWMNLNGELRRGFAVLRERSIYRRKKTVRRITELVLFVFVLTQKSNLRRVMFV